MKKMKLYILTVMLSTVFFTQSLPFSYADESIHYVGQIDTVLQKPIDVDTFSSEDICVLDEILSQVLIFDNLGNIKTTIGEMGSFIGQFKKPRALTVSPQEMIYVVDTGNKRIQVFNKKGEFEFQFGESGSRLGQFSEPSGIAVDQFGYIYVSDLKNKNIQIFTAKGIFLRAISTLFPPGDVDVDLQRNIYALNAQKAQIVKYSNIGEKVGSFQYINNIGKRKSDAKNIFVDLRGDMYISENSTNRVQKINQDNVQLIAFGSEGDGRGQFKKPLGISVNKEGQLYICDSENARIQMLKVYGSHKENMQKDDKLPPIIAFDMFISGAKKIVDTDFIPGIGLYALTDNKIILKGRTSKQFGKKGKNPGEFRHPMAISVNNEGEMFIADTSNDRIQILKMDGSLEMYLGKEGYSHETFDSPEGIIVNSEGMIFVADTKNHRIQIFDSEGVFIKAFGIRSSIRKSMRAPLGTFNYPKALAVNSKDDLFVLDSGNKRIQIFNKHGDFLTSFGSEGDSPDGLVSPVDIAIDEKDYVYIADQAKNCIHIFNSDLKYILSFGSYGNNDIGRFKKLSSVSASRGKIFVSDYKNNMIQMFRFSPESIFKDDRWYAIKIVTPSSNVSVAEEDITEEIRQVALVSAVKELSSKLGYSEEYIKSFVNIESEEKLFNGSVKIIVSIPKDIPVEIKTILPSQQDNFQIIK